MPTTTPTSPRRPRSPRWCHDRAVWVEAELGEVGGKDGVHARREFAPTRPQAAAYVRGHAASMRWPSPSVRHTRCRRARRCSSTTS
ncbi:MAG: hypothetical protein WKF83_05715 [Nocardioidaceae bacterium]